MTKLDYLKHWIADTYEPCEVLELLVDAECVDIWDVLDAFEEKLIEIPEFIPEDFQDEEAEDE